MENLYSIKLFSVFLLFAALIFLIQLCTPGFVGTGPYYHVKISGLMLQQGILEEFPWTQPVYGKSVLPTKNSYFMFIYRTTEINTYGREHHNTLSLIVNLSIYRSIWIESHAGHRCDCNYYANLRS